MNLIFCLSYLSLYQTIHLVEKYGANNFKIVTSNKNIKMFFSLFYSDSMVYYIKTNSILLPENLYQFILFPLKMIDIIIKKYIVWKIFKKIENRKIYFFFNAAGFFHAWILYKLSRKNKLFFEEDLNLNSFNLANTTRSKLNTWFVKTVYSEEVLALDQRNVINYKMSNKFLKKCRVNQIKIKFKFNTINNIISSKLNLPKGEILLLPPIIDLLGILLFFK